MTGSAPTEPLRVRNTRVLLAPLVPLALLAGALSLGLSRGATVVLLLLLLVVLGAAVLAALAPGIVVDARTLSVPGREDRRRAPGGSVDLDRLESATSVSYQGGLVSGRGLALFRSEIWLKDADGGEAMFLAWGWSPKTPLQLVLRQAVLTTRARMDPMTWWRLGFRNDQGARISAVRRFI